MRLLLTGYFQKVTEHRVSGAGLLKQVVMQTRFMTGSRVTGYYSHITISLFLRAWNVVFSGKGVGMAGESIQTTRWRFSVNSPYGALAARARLHQPGLVSKEGSQGHPESRDLLVSGVLLPPPSPHVW